MTNLETEEFLRAWLANLNLANRAEAFIAANWLGEQLLKLTREDLADLDVPKDQRGEVMLAIEALRQGDAPPTLPDRQAPSYAPALSEAAALARCRELGRQPPVPWVAAVADTWPGPIAHEYQRLRQVLEQGQIVAAIFQLKDVAEVLIKFPALVIARRGRVTAGPERLANDPPLARESGRRTHRTGNALEPGAERSGRGLRLAPLVALRRCAVCDQQDVFLYDSRGGRGLDDGFKLLDSLAGHGLTLPPHRAGELATEAGEWATKALVP